MSKEIGLTKIDVAVDLKGSFIPEASVIAYKKIKELLEDSLKTILEDKEDNFLSPTIVSDLVILK